MKELIEPDKTPPGGWRWTHPETKHTLHAHSAEGLFGLARKFLGNNGYPIPTDLNQRIVEDLNEEIQASCAAKGLPAYPFVKDTSPPSLAQKTRNFAYALTEWVKTGSPVSSQEQFDQRMSICETCQYWGGSSAFGHAACGKCGCSGLKLWLASQRCPAGKW